MTSPLPHARDPAPWLARIRAEWQAMGGPLWLFAYGSLIWKREFEVDDSRRARVCGWHRSFRMRSRINRGTPECPGLVLALRPGGSCHGLVLQARDAAAPGWLEALWAREMPTGTYTPRWLACRTEAGPVRALAFTLDRDSPAHVGPLDDEALLDILRHAQGRYGRTLDYLVQTDAALRAHGIPDHGLARQVQLARRHGLV